MCWYYRAEQTYHPPHRQFWENEVFKTGTWTNFHPLPHFLISIIAHFVEHSVRDVLEHVCVQFTPHYIVGRPRGPHWYPGMPLYVCDSRYVDKPPALARFAKITNWRFCVPPEARQAPPLYPFERPVYPPLLASPFQRGLRGPGAIVDPVTLAAMEAAKEEPVEEGGTIARRRSRRVPGGTTTTSKAAAAFETPSYAGPSHGSRFPLPVQTKQDGKRETVIGAAGGEANIKGHAIVESLPLDTSKHSFSASCSSQGKLMNLLLLLLSPAVRS